ncbi:peptidylprolyl isomerase [Enterococcus nangangensis]|uniref:peptidylprolyl isomerase n=1 Tax=Enterococcus nangangensis TaxID=2559926 RepID=UPI0010F819C8|nr:peptidylprolyl isomerase [Enterococcus nangangensis]
MSTFPQLDLANQKGPQAIITTNHGKITVQLFPEQAPKTVENFVQLSKKGYYDGIIFHRVIPGFMIQGGDPTGTGMGGESIYGEKFEDEFSREVFNLRGALSMANAGPNTNGSQFFIVQSDNVPDSMMGQLAEAGFPAEIVEAYRDGGTPWLDFRHTVFGQVTAGMDVVDAIANVKTGAQDRPAEDVVIEGIEIQD